jgi:hypothetical protein
MLVLRAACFRALANLAKPMLANEQSLRAMQAHTAGMNAKEITRMRYRTAVKTGRAAALQADALRPGSFVRYAQMVERLAALRDDLRVANRPSRALAPGAAARIHS